jgi:hypothetical protein
MNAAKFSSGDDRWPLMTVLTWIATRSLKLTEKLAFSHPAEAGRFLFETRRKFGASLQLSYSDSFHLLNEKIESRAIAGSGSKIKWTVEPVHEQLPADQCFPLGKISAVSEACAFHPQRLSNMNRGAGYRLDFADFTFHERDCLTPNGSGFGFPNPDGTCERWTWKAVSFAHDDVLRVFADWPVYSAWKLARGRGWEPPRGMSADWLRTLPAGRYVSLSDAVDLLAFGPGRLAIGLNSLEEHAARLRAGLALMRAARDAKVIFFGKTTFRLPQSPGQIAPPSALRRLEPTGLAGMTLVIDGARDWLGPACR